jgi:hypothetical protein
MHKVSRIPFTAKTTHSLFYVRLSLAGGQVGSRTGRERRGRRDDIGAISQACGAVPKNGQFVECLRESRLYAGLIA